jgi:hypothetical protein
MSNDEILTLITIILLFTTALIFMLRQGKKNKNRSIILEKIAIDLGLEFKEREKNDFILSLKKFHLVLDNAIIKIFNCMQGSSKDINYTVFDLYQNAMVGSTIIFNTIILFKSKQLNLPFFTLRNKSYTNNIKKLVSHKNIDFKNRPIFSEKYYLTGKDASRIKALFKDKLIDFFEIYSDVNTEGFDEYLIYYNPKKLVKPEKMKKFIEEGFKVYELFKESCHFH